MQLDEGAVRDAYRRWAPVYDYTFGAVSTAGRRHAVEIINSGNGRVLEVGVGTGLSLPDYKKHLDIVGIDLAPEMLEKARERVKAEKLTNISGLHEMDASNLRFPDNSFDTVVAMYVITVVPDPQKVMLELARVTKPGGEVMLVNHFSQERRRARLGRAADGAVRRSRRLALGIRRFARHGLPRPEADRPQGAAALGHLHDDALPQGSVDRQRPVAAE